MSLKTDVYQQLQVYVEISRVNYDRKQLLTIEIVKDNITIEVNVVRLFHFVVIRGENCHHIMCIL